MLFTNDLATREEVFAIPTPVGTRTHRPIGHGDIIHRTEMTLAVAAPEFTIHEQEFEIIKNGSRMFSAWSLTHKDDDEYRMALGIRNAHDKAFALSFATGKRVTVCSNMMFIGDQTVGRKHTTNILDDLPGLLFKILMELGKAKRAVDAKAEAYKLRALTDTEVHDIAIRGMDAGVYASGQIGKVLGEYRNPTHEAFEARNVWSFENACTQVLKDANSFDLPSRTTRLAGLLDSVVATDGEIILN